jgi:hypothetical protein
MSGEDNFTGVQELQEFRSCRIRILVARISSSP